MSKETEGPDGEYYERPYFPDIEERKNWRRLPLRPHEAKSLLEKSNHISKADADALRAIADGDFHPDHEVDVFQMYQEDTSLDNGYGDDDWYEITFADSD